MLRWKLFIPLALVLTVAGLLGSYFWSVSASTRTMSALNEQAAADIEVNGGSMIISIEGGQTLATVLGELDTEPMGKAAAKYAIQIKRSNSAFVDEDLINQVDLVVAQAVATSEFYQANLMLKDLAAQWGYNGELVIWQGRVVAEVSDDEHSYIAHSPVREVIMP